MRSRDGRIYKFYRHSKLVGGESIGLGVQVVRDFGAISLR